MEFIKVTEQKEPLIALIELYRPKELNALNPKLMEELRDALLQLDKNDNRDHNPCEFQALVCLGLLVLEVQVRLQVG